MRKNKLNIFIAILTSILLISFGAICNQCAAPPKEEEALEEVEEEIEREETEEEIVYEIAFGSEYSIFSCEPDGSDIKRIYNSGFRIGDPC